jgi:diguanylate cyclase (GGDEF)-like protein
VIAHAHDDTLALDVLNALSASIAVLDRDGVIQGVNDAWLRFGRENGATDEHCYVGMSYLSVCEEALSRQGDLRLEQIVADLRALLGGTKDEFCVEYPCDTPSEERWYALTGTRLRRDAGGGVVLMHEDITARRRTEGALRETERMLRSMLDALPVGVWIMNADGVITLGNPAGIRIWAGARYVGPEQFGEYKGWWVSTGLPIAPHEWAASRAIRLGETAINEEIEIECFDGTRKVILNSAIPLRDERQAIRGAIIVNEDITARKEYEVELERAKEEVEATSRELAEALDRERMIARVDALTGTATRRHFFDLSTQGVSVASRYGEPLSLILFDIDDFKRTNDTLGHQAGDELLRSVARVGRRYLRDADIFARYGGDEFIVLLPRTPAAEAAIVAERIRQDVASRPVVTGRGVAHVTISSGIAGLAGPDDTLEKLISRADLALYDAKRTGRNRTCEAPAEA